MKTPSNASEQPKDFLKPEFKKQELKNKNEV